MRRITIQQVEAFYWTATLGSVQKAAGRLGITQPAVSLRLKEFETNVGIPLFERAGRRLRTSPAAREFMKSAGALLDLAESFTAQSGARIGGTIRVGFAEGFALGCLPQVLERLHRTYPDLHPEITVATSSSIEPALYGGELDLAFLVEPGEREGHAYIYLGLQPTAWVVSPRWSMSGPVTPSELSKIRVISNQPGTIGYRQVVRWFGAEGLRPEILDICSSVAIQAKLIEAGTGIGILPVRMVDDKLREGSLVVLETFPQVQPVAVFLVHRTDALTPSVRAFIDCVGETISDMHYLT